MLRGRKKQPWPPQPHWLHQLLAVAEAVAVVCEIVARLRQARKEAKDAGVGGR